MFASGWTHWSGLLFSVAYLAVYGGALCPDEYSVISEIWNLNYSMLYGCILVWDPEQVRDADERQECGFNYPTLLNHKLSDMRFVCRGQRRFVV